MRYLLFLGACRLLRLMDFFTIVYLFSLLSQVSAVAPQPHKSRGFFRCTCSMWFSLYFLDVALRCTSSSHWRNPPFLSSVYLLTLFVYAFVLRVISRVSQFLTFCSCSSKIFVSWQLTIFFVSFQCVRFNSNSRRIIDFIIICDLSCFNSELDCCHDICDWPFVTGIRNNLL